VFPVLDNCGFRGSGSAGAVDTRGSTSMCESHLIIIVLVVAVETKL